MNLVKNVGFIIYSACVPNERLKKKFIYFNAQIIFMTHYSLLACKVEIKQGGNSTSNVINKERSYYNWFQ